MPPFFTYVSCGRIFREHGPDQWRNKKAVLILDHCVRYILFCTATICHHSITVTIARHRSPGPHVDKLYRNDNQVARPSYIINCVCVNACSFQGAFCNGIKRTSCSKRKSSKSWTRYIDWVYRSPCLLSRIQRSTFDREVLL